MAVLCGRYFIVFFIGLFIATCGTPFLPETDVPIERPVDAGLRSTPQGVIEQLIESYETRRIELFKDLLPTDGSFQFFITPDYFDDYVVKYPRLSETKDERLNYIGDGIFNYWTQERELENHDKLFSRVDEIEFVDKPTIEVRTFSDNGDSLAELLATGGMMKITDDKVDSIFIYNVKIEKQVFLLKRDAENLWVIRKWYDFSREGG